MRSKHLIRTFWITLVIAISVRTLLRPESHTVFPIFAQGSHHWWSNDPLYADYAPLDYFRYPPLFAVLFTPFSLMGNALGGVVWSCLSVGVFLLGLRMLWAALDQSRQQRSLFELLAGLGALSGLWNAQSNALIIGLILIGASYLHRERWWLASFFLCLSVSLKLTSLPLLLLLLALWPRQLLLRSLLFLLIGALIPFLTRPPDVVLSQYQAWTQQMQELSSKRWPGFRDGWTVVVVIEHLWHGGEGLPDLKAPLHSMAYRIVQLFTAGLVLLWCFYLRRRGLSRNQILLGTLSMGSAWMMLLGPATEHPTYAFLSPFLAWAVLVDWPRGRLLIWTSAFLILILGWRAVTASLHATMPWLLLILPFGTLLFVVWLLCALPRK